MNTHTPCWLIVGRTPLSQGELVHQLYEWGVPHKLVKYTSPHFSSEMDGVVVVDDGTNKAMTAAMLTSPRPLVHHQDANGQVYAVDVQTGDRMHLGKLITGATASDLTGARYFTDPTTGYHYVLPEKR